MISNDSPITGPREDEFGIDPFAQAVAKAIERLSAPEGTVLALTGPWGSGKSSAVNLVIHHLKQVEESGDLKIITFNPWWYSDEQMLARAFFQHLYAGLDRAGAEKARQFVLAVADVIKTERTAEETYRLLSGELRKQSSRFLIVVDDIDRLSPDQALLVFRLVKSVGRLPNVIYLLAFDREFAERLLTERYPAERHFLEKIVQASFEVPPPDPQVLRDALLTLLIRTTARPADEDMVRFHNVLADVINPLITLPRDLGRYLSNVSVTWAGTGADVDTADLLAIESLRLFRLPVYQAIRANKGMLCGTGNRESRVKNIDDIYDGVFLASATTESERDYLRTALRRIFPRLDSVWSNTSYTSTAMIWRTKRRICDPGHFASYFRMSLGPDVLPRRILEELFKHTDEAERVKAFFRERARSIRKNRQTEVPIVLDDLLGAPDRISRENFPIFLGALFEIADELDLPQDKDSDTFGDNHLRIHWLLNEFVRDRLPQSERNALFSEIVPKAAFGWMISIVSRLQREHYPISADKGTEAAIRLVDKKTADELTDRARGRIRDAARSGALLSTRNLLDVLFRWREFSDGPHGEVRAYTDQQLGDHRFVVSMAETVTSVAWVTNLGFDGMGDRVSRGSVHIQMEGLDTILDVPRFLSRLDEVGSGVLNDSDNEILSRFREGFKAYESEQAHRSAG